MRPVDEKIVRMKMENADFKNKAKETVTMFDQLNRGMQFGKDNLNISRMAEGIAAIERRFSATGVVVANIISRLTDSAINLGKTLVSNIMDPLVEGGKKRALNIEQAKFQFEGLGMDIEETMASALAAVKGTAFGLDEAAVVAASFGATGMRAGEEMTSSLRAISGVAAMTGSAYSDVGNIFTSVAGNGRLMGNDLLRLSSRGINAAATLAKSMNITEAEVREMVTKGEISFEIFASAMDEAFGEHATKANETYTGSLSNMKAALSRIGAAVATPHFENMRDIFNAITPLIDAAFDALVPFIDTWNAFAKMNTDNFINFLNSIDFSEFVKLGGMSDLAIAFWNILSSGLDILKAVRDGFQEVFPPMTLDTLLALTDGIREFTNRMKLSGKGMENLTRIFQAVFSVFSIGIELGKMLGGIFLELIPEGTTGKLLDMVMGIADLIIEFETTLKSSEKVQANFEAIRETVGNVVEGFIEFRDALGKAFSSFGSVLDTIWTFIGPTVSAIAEAVATLMSKVTLNDLLNGGLIGFMVLGAHKIEELFYSIERFISRLSGTVFGMGESFRVFEDLGRSLKIMMMSVQADALLKIAGAVAILVVALQLLATIDAQDLSKGIFTIAALMTMLSISLKSMTNLQKSWTQIAEVAVLLPVLAGAIIVLAAALKIMASMDAEELGRGLAGLVVIVTTLTASMIALSNLSGPMKTSSFTLVGVAVAVVVLAGAVKILGEMDTQNLSRGVISVGIILAQLAIFMKIVDRTKFGVGTAVGVTIIAGAVHIMILAIKSIADIPVDDIKVGLLTITAVLAQIAIFTKVVSGSKTMTAALSMVLIAAGINLLVGPIKELGSTDLETLAIGLGSMAIALGLVVGAMVLASGGLAGAAAITIVAVALNILVVPLRALGAMSIMSLVISLTALAGAFTIIGLAAKLIGLGGAGVLLALAAAIGAIGLAALGVAAAITAFATAFAVLSVTTVNNVKNILEVFVLFLDGLITLVPKFIELIFTFVTGMAEALAENGPRIARAAGQFILGILEAIRDYLPDIVIVGAEIVIGLMDAIGEEAPDLLDAGIRLIVDLLDGMSQAVIDNEEALVGAVMDTIGAIMVIVVEALVQLVEVIFGWIPGVESKAREMGDAAKDGLYEAFDLEKSADDRIDEMGRGIGSREGDANFWGTGLGGTLMDGVDEIDGTPTGSGKADEIIDGVKSKYDEGRGAGKGLTEQTDLGAGSVSIMDTGSQIGEGFTNGIGSKNYLSQITGKGLANKAKDGASGVSLYGTGSNFAAGFANGIANSVYRVTRSATGMVNSARGAVQHAAAIRSPSRKTMEDGVNFGKGLAIGIDKEAGHVAGSAREMALGAVETVRSYAAMFTEELMDQIDLNPIITPVLDLANMKDIDFKNSKINTRGIGVDTRGVDTRREQEPVQHNEYNITVEAHGDVPESTVKRMAKQVHREIKKTNDRAKMSRGEAVIF